MFYTIEELVQQADRDYQGNIAELMIATETELTGRERPEILSLMTRNLEVMKDSVPTLILHQLGSAYLITASG